MSTIFLNTQIPISRIIWICFSLLSFLWQKIRLAVIYTHICVTHLLSNPADSSLLKHAADTDTRSDNNTAETAQNLQHTRLRS